MTNLMTNADPLLLDLYRCAAQPGHWPQVLDRLCEDTGACSAVVQAIGFDGDRTRLRWQATDRRSARRPPPPQARLAAAENPRFARHRALRGLGRVVRDDELFDRDDPERAALDQQLAGIGIGRFLGTLLPLQDGSYLAVALHRAVDETRDFGRAAGNRLTAIAPHLRQALELGGQLQQARQGLQQLQTHLDTLHCGLLICDAQARVQWMNRSARALTGPGQPLHLQDATLRARSAAACSRLHGEIATAVSMNGQGTRFMPLGDGDGTLHLALKSQGPGISLGLGITGAGAMAEDVANAEPSVMIAITRAGDAADVPHYAWCRLLGITPAEAALVASLVRGGTVEQHAQLRGITAGTARIQLKQALAKTGTHRQAELVRLALSSAAAHVLTLVD